MNTPTTIFRIGKLALLSMMVMLSLGSASANGTSAKFVARSTLSPQTVPSSPAPVVVQERIVRASAPKVAQSAPQKPIVGGGNGYVMAGNNCVACVRAMTGRGQNGNAGSWKASSSTPTVGAIMIWRPGQGGASGAGHVGVVTGINSDGTVNIAHCNWPGQTRFQSTGLFW